MTREDFMVLVEAWGSDIARWPQHRQDAARQFSVTDEGRAILADAHRFDRLLSISPDIDARRSANVAFAVTQRVAAVSRREARWRDWLPRWWVPASLACSLVCSALIGVSLAVVVPPGSDDKPETTIDQVLGGGVDSFWSVQ